MCYSRHQLTRVYSLFAHHGQLRAAAGRDDLLDHRAHVAGKQGAILAREQGHARFSRKQSSYVSAVCSSTALKLLRIVGQKPAVALTLDTTDWEEDCFDRFFEEIPLDTMRVYQHIKIGIHQPYLVYQPAPTMVDTSKRAVRTRMLIAQSRPQSLTIFIELPEDTQGNEEWAGVDSDLRVANMSAVRRYTREIYELVDSRCQVVLDFSIHDSHDEFLASGILKDIAGSKLAQGRVSWRFGGYWQPSGSNSTSADRSLLDQIANTVGCMPSSAVTIRTNESEIDLAALTLFSDTNPRGPPTIASHPIVQLDLEFVRLPRTGSLPADFPNLKHLSMDAADLRIFQHIVTLDLARLDLVGISDLHKEMPLLLEHVFEAYPRLEQLSVELNAEYADHAGLIIAACRSRGCEPSFHLSQNGFVGLWAASPCLRTARIHNYRTDLRTAVCRDQAPTVFPVLRDLEVCPAYLPKSPQSRLVQAMNWQKIIAFLGSNTFPELRILKLAHEIPTYLNVMDLAIALSVTDMPSLTDLVVRVTPFAKVDTADHSLAVEAIR